ncbi:MAG TPA: hypothetical protein PKM57_03905 [Kiritimatiellia bacterium]|nr:hypothetical protein [Kiritimatiellia bacterium]HPS09607.1 hypothetical protein [Kiritimatiellia bacterium]
MWARDADGVTASWEYDASCRLKRLLSYPTADTPVVTVIAWSNSLPVSVTDPCGRVTAFSYDAQGYISGVLPQVGPAVSFENDSLGNRRRIIMPSADSSSNRLTLVDCDQIGRNSTVTYPDGLVETLRHDACGNPTSHVSRACRRTDLTWLPSAHVGSVKSWLDPATPVAVSYNYDLLFRTMAVTDPLGHEVERYVLDDEDRVTAATNLEGQVFSAVYGAGGLSLTMTRYDGVSVSNVWDSLGNRLGVLHKPAGASEWSSVSGYGWSRPDGC